MPSGVRLSRGFPGVWGRGRTDRITLELVLCICIAPDLRFSVGSMVARCRSGAKTFVQRMPLSVMWTAQVAWHIISHGAHGVSMRGLSPTLCPLSEERGIWQMQQSTWPPISKVWSPRIHPWENIASEKHQRLLTEALYSSWAGPGAGRLSGPQRTWVLFVLRNPAIVPDVFLSLDVEVPHDWWQKEHRSYLLWEFGKPPDVVIEIVSNTAGGEADEKRQKYARMRVIYYIIYDPAAVMPEVLTIYRPGGIGQEP